MVHGTLEGVMDVAVGAAVFGRHQYIIVGVTFLSLDVMLIILVGFFSR